jgi:hypothetical protein
MPKSQQPSFTPAFAAAFKDVTTLVGTTRERLAAQHKDLSPEQRSQVFKKKLELLQNLNLDAASEQKMLDFLLELNKTLEDKELAQELERIKNLNNNNNNNNNNASQALKALFQKEVVLQGCMNYWNMYIKAQYKDSSDDMRRVFEGNAHEAGEVMINVATQGNYDPEKRVVNDFIRLLFELFDMVLVQAGYSPALVSDIDKEDPGLWDAKQGIHLGKTVHLPGGH